MIVNSCIALVAAGATTVLPTQTMTLSWKHTVEKTVWEEEYSASADGVSITEARIEGIGAGMEPPAGAVLEGRRWRYRPSLPPLSSVDLANSSFGGGYALCWNATCRPLGSIVPRGNPVSVIAAECADARP